MAALKKVSAKDVVKKKESKPKAGTAKAAKTNAKPAKSAAAKPKTTRAAKAATPKAETKATTPKIETKTATPKTETKTSKLGGLIKRVAKVLPRKKISKQSPKQAKAAAAKTAAAAPTPAPATAGPMPLAGDSRLVLMMRDPQTLHAFWTISPADREKHGLDKAGGAPPLLLRLYDRESGNGAAEVYRAQIVVASTERWTVQVPPSGRSWRAEIGFIGRDGQFHAIASSNLVVLQGPPLQMSIQEGKVGVPFGEGGEALRAWAGKFEMPVMSPLPTQPGQPGSLMQPLPALLQQPGSMMGQPGSQMGLQQPAEKQKGYWLQVQTELILYGSTVPGSQLTVQDIPVELAEDGSFSLRFALPEGFHVLPVHAISPDGDDERTITPIVLRLTQ